MNTKNNKLTTIHTHLKKLIIATALIHALMPIQTICAAAYFAPTPRATAHWRAPRDTKAREEDERKEDADAWVIVAPEVAAHTQAIATVTQPVRPRGGRLRQTITEEEISTFFVACSHAATYQNKIAILERMIQIISIDATITATIIHEMATPLTYAIWNQNTDVAEILIKLGADVHKTNKNDDTPLHTAALQHTADVIPILIQYGADIDKANAQGATPLMEAINFESYNKAHILIKHGADINKISAYGFTALMIAIRKNNDQLIATLILAGATYTKEQLKLTRNISRTIKRVIESAREAKRNLGAQNWLPEDFVATQALPIAQDQQELQLRHLIAQYAAPYHEIPEIEHAIVYELARQHY